LSSFLSGEPEIKPQTVKFWDKREETPKEKNDEAEERFRGRRATETDSKHRFPVLESRSTEPGGPGVNGKFGVAVTPQYVNTHELYPEGYDGSCLRPLGLCELGGCCDTCWYGGKRKNIDLEE